MLNKNILPVLPIEDLVQVGKMAASSVGRQRSDKSPDETTTRRGSHPGGDRGREQRGEQEVPSTSSSSSQDVVSGPTTSKQNKDTARHNKKAIVSGYLLGNETIQVLEGVDLPRFVRENETTLSFPEKLMLMLTHVEIIKGKGTLEEEQPCICWGVDGLSFSIYSKKTLVDDLLPTFFPKSSKYASFTRKLYRWGFRQLGSTGAAPLTAAAAENGAAASGQSRNRGVTSRSLPTTMGGSGMFKDAMSFGHDSFQRDNRSLINRMRSVTAAGTRRALASLAVKQQQKILEGRSAPSPSISGPGMRTSQSWPLMQHQLQINPAGANNLQLMLPRRSSSQQGLAGNPALGMVPAVSAGQHHQGEQQRRRQSSTDAIGVGPSSPTSGKDHGGFPFSLLHQQLSSTTSTNTLASHLAQHIDPIAPSSSGIFFGGEELDFGASSPASSSSQPSSSRRSSNDTTGVPAPGAISGSLMLKENQSIRAIVNDSGQQLGMMLPTSSAPTTPGDGLCMNADLLPQQSGTLLQLPQHFSPQQQQQQLHSQQQQEVAAAAATMMPLAAAPRLRPFATPDVGSFPGSQQQFGHAATAGFYGHATAAAASQQLGGNAAVLLQQGGNATAALAGGGGGGGSSTALFSSPSALGSKIPPIRGFSGSQQFHPLATPPPLRVPPAFQQQAQTMAALTPPTSMLSPSVSNMPTRTMADLTGIPHNPLQHPMQQWPSNNSLQQGIQNLMVQQETHPEPPRTTSMTTVPAEQQQQQEHDQSATSQQYEEDASFAIHAEERDFPSSPAHSWSSDDNDGF